MKCVSTGRLGLVLAAAAGVAAVAGAEPLNPPSGPVAGTGAVQIFSLPFTIDEPGSYRLARDVVSPGGNGITISADNVTLDLGGHVMDGGGAGVGVEGILLSGNREGVTIQNGTITNWGNAAIFDGFSADTGVVVREIRATNLGLEGIRLSESDALVIECIVTNAEGPGGAAGGTEGGALSGQGIWVGDNSRIVDCKVVNAGDEGILAGDHAVVTGCIVVGATFLEGAAGIAVGNNSIVENCTVSESFSGGFAVGQNSLVRNCAATENVAPAAFAGGSMTVDRRTGDLVPLFDPGDPVIDPRTGDASIDATWSLLTTEGVGAAEGFVVGASSRVIDCVATNNSGTGFFLSDRSSISGCVANANGGDGISVVNDNVVKNNRATVNAGNGIMLGSNGNHCSDNYLSVNTGAGILVNDGFAVVIRNHFELDNLDNAFAASLVGPINDLTSPTSNWSQ